ncbi:MAG: hypothetical protein Q7S59_11760 [Sulfurimonas sp.]|nr:hypothetical protein [Sulfurimonas sp.]
MKVIFTAVITILISSSLGAYTKQIVFDSFKDSESANAAFEKLKSDESYSKLELISKENDFNIHVIGSSGQNLLVAEPIKNQFILEETLKLVVPKFMKATVRDIENRAKTISDETSSTAEFPKKILFGSFSQKEGAYEEFKKFQEDEVYEKLKALATENDFVIHVRPLEDYTVLIIEPIKNQEMYEEVMSLLQSKYEGAYGRKYSGAVEEDNIGENQKQSLEEPVSALHVANSAKVKTVDKNVSATKADVNSTKLLAHAAKKDTNISAVQTDSNKSKADVNSMTIKVDTNITAPLVKEINTTSQATKESNNTAAVETTVVTKSVESVKKEETIVVKKVKKEEVEEESSYAMFIWLFILGIAAGAIIYAYPKAKRVYDQY